MRYNVVKGYTEYCTRGESEYKHANEMFINTQLIDLKFRKIKTNYNEISQLLNSSIVDQFNPFLNYFNNLPKWDSSKPSEIMRLADTIKTDDQDYFKLCLRRWLIALVASATNVNTVNQQMIVLSGKQGLGKSTWISNLIPTQLSEYHYSGTVNPNNKDTYIHLSETLVINLDELTNMNKKETSRFKEIITQGTINVRRPFGKSSQKLTRRASFIGSINESEFLYDLTGSRRFLCFMVDNIKYKNDINLDLVYAEAIHSLNQGEKYYFDKEDIDLIEEKNDRFRVKSPVEIKLLDQFSATKKIDSPKKYHLNEDEILLVLRPITVLMKINPNKYKYQPPSMGELKEIGSILTMHKFKSKKIKGRKYYELHRNIPKVEGQKIYFEVDQNEKH